MVRPAVWSLREGTHPTHHLCSLWKAQTGPGLVARSGLAKVEELDMDAKVRGVSGAPCRWGRGFSYLVIERRTP